MESVFADDLWVLKDDRWQWVIQIIEIFTGGYG